MEKNEIYAISEAFSMQPQYIYVGATMNGNVVALIKKELINFPVAGDPFEHIYYVGYDINGKRLFEYRGDTVNVQFR